MEYVNRKKKPKREDFLETMEDIISWEEWMSIAEPVYPKHAIFPRHPAHREIIWCPPANRVHRSLTSAEFPSSFVV